MPGRNSTKSNCGVCLQKIIDGKEEAIFCEGKCQDWYHRGCASVPRELFTTLTASNVPFLCLTCSNSSLQQEVAELTVEIRRMQEALNIISKLRDENTALSREITELRAKLDQLDHSRTTATGETATTTDARAPTYSQVARSRPRGRRNNKVGYSSRSQDGVQARSTEQDTQQSPVNRRESRCAQPKQSNRPLVSVKGARKVWKTFKFVTASTVSHAVHVITGIPITSLSIKRKFRYSAGKRM